VGHLALALDWVLKMRVEGSTHIEVHFRHQVDLAWKFFWTGSNSKKKREKNGFWWTFRIDFETLTDCGWRAAAAKSRAPWKNKMIALVFAFHNPAQALATVLPGHERWQQFCCVKTVLSRFTFELLRPLCSFLQRRIR